MAFLTEGYQTLILLGSPANTIFQGNALVGGGVAAGSVFLKEKEVQPPMLEMGGPIDVTTQRNAFWETKMPRKLQKVGPVVTHCSYDPAAYPAISALMGVLVSILVIFPDGSQLGALYGWLEKFVPTSNKAGDFPLAEVTLEIANKNLSGLEALQPVQFVPASGGGAGVVNSSSVRNLAAW
jgi:hypothetical protein